VNEQPVRTAFRSDLLRLLTPLAALAAMASFAAREAVPAGAAESLYLALLATAVLLPAGFLAPWPAFELGLGSALATAVVWGLSPGPGRGAAMAVVLLGILAVAAGRALTGRVGEGLRIGVAIPLALGLQVLMRGDLLFGPVPALRTAVALVALPAVGGIAVSVLARRHGTALALIAGGTALLPAPGLNVSSTLALVALAAGDFLAWERTGRISKGIAAVALLAPIAWAPGPGIAMAVCGLALWRPWIGLGLAVPAAAGLAWLSPAPWTATALQAVWLPLLVPAALVPQRDRIASIASIITAVLMAATIPQVPNVATLAAPLALAALSMRRDAAFAVPQAVWTGALAAGTALLAGYPWLREEPLSTALSRLGLPPGPALAAWTAGLFLALAGLGVLMGRSWSEPVRSARLAGVAAACLALASMLGLPHAGTPLLAPEVPVVLDAGHPAWESRVPGPAVGSVVVESSLSNGAGLARGTPVAIVRLRDAAGRSLDWTLRAGEATGEWAARRPDVARAGVTAPRPWISWIAGDFFAQRYRTRWTLERPERAAVLRVERAPGVPPDLEVAVYQVEVRR
jgi:hypothetical protein